VYVIDCHACKLLKWNQANPRNDFGRKIETLFRHVRRSGEKFRVQVHHEMYEKIRVARYNNVLDRYLRFVATRHIVANIDYLGCAFRKEK